MGKTYQEIKGPSIERKINCALVAINKWIIPSKLSTPIRDITKALNDEGYDVTSKWLLRAFERTDYKIVIENGRKLIYGTLNQTLLNKEKLQ